MTPSQIPPRPAVTIPSEHSIAETQLSVAPGSFISTIKDEDSILGHQLTEQYRRAIGGMTEVLKFGAMIMLLREKLSKDGQLFVGGHGRGHKEGISEWMRQHTPEIKHSTAYRFLHVAEAVAQDFQLPAKVSFVQLATTPAAELPDKLKLKQDELWDFVSGTSQRSWLDRFAPQKSRGGSRDGAGRPSKDSIDPQTAIASLKEDIKNAFESLALLTKEAAFKVLNDAEIDGSLDIAEAWLSAAKKWRSMPKRERENDSVRTIFANKPQCSNGATQSRPNPARAVKREESAGQHDASSPARSADSAQGSQDDLADDISL